MLLRTILFPLLDTLSTTDVEKDNDESLPEHFFVPNTIIGKTGKMKGVTRTAWTLIIGPHTFKKHRNKNNISYFSCNDCLTLF